jgi:hypothetical protein
VEQHSSGDAAKNTSTLQIFCTVTSIAFSGRTEIGLDEIYETLAEKKISNANYASNITTVAVKPMITFDKQGRRIYLSPHRRMLGILDKHKAFLKQYLGKGKASVKLVPVKPDAQETSASNAIVPIEPRYVLKGFGAIIKELPSDYRVFIHAPKLLIDSSLDGKRTMVLFYLSALREIGINEASYKNITRMLSDNRMGTVAMPRDLTLKNDFLIHDKEKRSFSSSQSSASKELLASLVDYKLSGDNISSKMQEILPLMKTIVKENPKGHIERSKLVGRCREKGIALMLPRDIPRIFGFCHRDNFYFSPWAFDAAFKLMNTK